MKIAVVSDTYTPDINGVANSLGFLVKGLREIGHEVEVIRAGLDGEDWTHGVRFWHLPGYWEIRVGLVSSRYLRRRWESGWCPEIVYIAIETPLGLAAMRAAKRLNIPMIGGFHTNFQKYLEDYGFRWLGRIVGRYQKWFHLQMAGTLVPSPCMQGKLNDEGYHRVDILGRGVNCSLFQPGKRSQNLRDQWGAST